MSKEPDSGPAFSHRVKVAQVSHVPTELRIRADERQRAAIAKLWDILSVEALTADVKIRRWKKDGVKVIGTVHAEVTQACVVTLEPVPEVIDEEFEENFVPEGSALARIPANDAGEIVVDPDGPDIELFSGDEIDVGAFVAEMAAMALDPYPRKAGVEFAEHIEGDAAQDKKPSPFAVLKNMKLEK
ncbi:YceD family protein [Rhizobium sp.]